MIPNASTACGTVQKLIERYNAPVPRYTSYPTAPHFEAKTPDTYQDWLAALAPGSSVSLYLHIPFCDTLCWFCACHTKHTLRYAPVSAYLKSLYREIETVAALLPAGVEIRHIHWGGGSPTLLKAKDIITLAALLRSRFPVTHDAEFGVEIDPRDLGEDRLDALAQAGVNRVSIGVQDFDPVVQEAINRRQSYEETAASIAGLRARGISSINLDLLYGLPHQSEESLVKTAHQIASLNPNRVSMFGYAHVPWMKAHQKLIDEDALPDSYERFQQSARGATEFINSGFEPIGMDHFAKPDDELAIAASQGNLRRNFQGYTTDVCDALLGFGASAIGQLPQGYLQNEVPTAEYRRRVDETGLATKKGLAFSSDDRMRAHVIERLMCDFALSKAKLSTRFGPSARVIFNEAERLVNDDYDELFEAGKDGFIVTKKGRPFIRSICAHFDKYLDAGRAKHSIAV
jgi:oxygen-independent coproporphyrinogen-3 oxidase